MARPSRCARFFSRRTWQHMVRLYAQTVGDGTGSYPVRITHPEGAQTPQRV